MKILMTEKEMPRDCADCPFSSYEYSDFQCLALKDDLNNVWHEDKPYKRLKNCPLVLDK